MGTRAKLIIGTRPGERPFKLKLDPADRVNLPWIKDSTFSTTINLSNPTSDIQLYKIKCTDNKVFRVQPPMGFLDPSGTVEVKVYQYAKTRPEENKHFLMFLHHPVSAADKNSKKDMTKIWKGDGAADGVTRMQAYFEEPKGGTKAITGASKNKTVGGKESCQSKEEISRRKSQKSTMGPPVTTPSAARKSAGKKNENAAAKKKNTPRKKGSNAGTHSKEKTNTAEEKTTN